MACAALYSAAASIVNETECPGHGVYLCHRESASYASSMASAASVDCGSSADGVVWGGGHELEGWCRVPKHPGRLSRCHPRRASSAHAALVCFSPGSPCVEYPCAPDCVSVAAAMLHQLRVPPAGKLYRRHGCCCRRHRDRSGPAPGEERQDDRLRW